MAPNENSKVDVKLSDFSPDDLCATCSIGWDCCTHLSSLRLSKSEYEQHFAHREDKITVQREGPLYVVSSKEEGACPNFDKGCSVYDYRPIECRLFPYTLYMKRRDSNGVTMGFHSRTNCPQKEKLLMQEIEAKELIRHFARNAFGDINIEIQKDGLAKNMKQHIRKIIKKFYQRKER